MYNFSEGLKQEAEQRFRDELADALKAIRAELAEVKAVLTALQAKQKPAKE